VICSEILKARHVGPPETNEGLLHLLPTQRTTPYWRVATDEYRAVFEGECGVPIELTPRLVPAAHEGLLCPSLPGPPLVITPVPEPGVWALLVLVPALAWLRRAQKRRDPARRSAWRDLRHA
jgi:hypothetical protein